MIRARVNRDFAFPTSSGGDAPHRCGEIPPPVQIGHAPRSLSRPPAMPFRWSHGLDNKQTLFVALTATFAAVGVFHTAKALLTTNASRTTRIYRAQRPTEPGSDEDAAAAAPYPPNALPGARDVDGPHGCTRVYEWGPAQGRKVLFVHGISTPSVALARLAALLAARRGCRVMLFDLHGRGHSDAPDSGVVRQDMGLWAGQVLAVLASAEGAWTGDGGFALVGYSMGGGIAAAFASYFPRLVRSLVLIAPGGLIRPERFDRSGWWLYHSWLPRSVVHYFVARRLRGPREREEETTGLTDAVESELPSHPALAPDSRAPVLADHPTVSIADTVAWEIRCHPGFLPSFVSSIKYAPVADEHERWRLIGRRCAAQRGASPVPGNAPGLDEGKVLVLLGEQDAVIVADETEEDATMALGRENVKVVRLAGGHDLPIVNAQGCMEQMSEFWEDASHTETRASCSR